MIPPLKAGFAFKIERWREKEKKTQYTPIIPRGVGLSTRRQKFFFKTRLFIVHISNTTWHRLGLSKIHIRTNMHKKVQKNQHQISRRFDFCFFQYFAIPLCPFYISGNEIMNPVICCVRCHCTCKPFNAFFDIKFRLITLRNGALYTDLGFHQLDYDVRKPNWDINDKFTCLILQIALWKIFSRIFFHNRKKNDPAICKHLAHFKYKNSW